MLNLQYFASVREQLGRESEQLDLPADVTTVADLAAWLAERGAPWALLTDAQQVLVAVDQEVVDRERTLTGQEEVAFFPPMTGG
ncbi:molybdopterin converting factor subunit 1 [Pseudohongiella sp. SYSU M77423]|uniref:molybdopterin converting factor subunit 1 n=1 Tax=Pseudohongiella sp. SYSU M77423 TaxID=3042312 RepID=UPI002480B11B|nr:molybdopterin converting factor subunit 1 [Pseudohongiella sp. SYSU M77423]MDH7943092.1 molybdopterin converting factor subunit 1 [Pseudohongiella sp. SYSU M77423]|tara:strand:+ start:112758 stop:113009 length:252 start_codon:yes stop_codon:yes gene_type:complete